MYARECIKQEKRGGEFAVTGHIPVHSTHTLQYAQESEKKSSECMENSQSKISSKCAAHCERKTVRHRVGQVECMYVLYLYIHLCVCICVHARRFTRLVQQGRQATFICKQPRTLVCRMEREHRKRLEGGGAGGRGRENMSAREAGWHSRNCMC